MNVYVKDSQISADLSTLSATGKAQKGKKFFVDLLMLVHTGMGLLPHFWVLLLDLLCNTLTLNYNDYKYIS